MDPTLAALWERVLEAWDEDERHGKLVGYAQANGLLGEAAKLYREASGGSESPYRLDETQVADAKRRLGGIAALAIMDLDVTRGDRSPAGGLRAVRIAATLIFATSIALLGWALLRK